MYKKQKNEAGCYNWSRLAIHRSALTPESPIIIVFGTISMPISALCFGVEVK